MLARLFFAFLLTLHASAANADALDNFLSAPGFVVEFEDYASVIEGQCNSGKTEYCQNLVSLLEQRKNADANREKISQIKKTIVIQNETKCDNGDLMACQYAGIKYRKEYGNTDNPEKSREYSEKFDNIARLKCNNRDGVGCFYVSLYYLQRESETFNEEKGREFHDLSIKYFSEACDGGDGSACSLLAYRYKHGTGFGSYIAADTGRAVALFDAACGHGYIDACIELSNIYSWGQYVKKDKLKVRYYSEKGCDLESAIACSNILRSGAKLSKEEKMKIRDKVAFLAKRNCANGRFQDCSQIQFSNKGFR
jgi:TPR repeat protein